MAAVAMTDTNIEIAIEDELILDQAVSSHLVDIQCRDGIVTLTGQVDSWSEYDAATQNALEGGAVVVDNELNISSVNP